MSDPMNQIIELLRKADVPVLVGLRQQGHIPTVRRMLADGKSWIEIGSVIGWQAVAVERWYDIEMAPAMLFLEGAKWLADVHGLTVDTRGIYTEALRRYPKEARP